MIGQGDALADGKFRWCDSSHIGRQTRAVEPTRLPAISDAAFAVILKSHALIAARLLASLAYMPAKQARRPINSRCFGSHPGSPAGNIRAAAQ